MSLFATLSDPPQVLKMNESPSVVLEEGDVREMRAEISSCQDLNSVLRPIRRNKLKFASRV